MYQLSRSKRDVQNAFSGVGHKDNIDYSIPDDSTVVKQSRRMRKLQEPKIEISKPGSKPVSQESQEEPEKPVESIWKPIQSPFSEYKSSPEKPVESIWKPIQFPFSESSKKNQDVPEEEVKEEKDTEGQEEVEKEEEEVEEDTEGQKEEEEVEEDTESQEEEIEKEKEKEEVEDTEGQQDGQEEEIPDDESIEKEPESIENNEEESRKPEPLENPVTYEYLGESYYLDNLKFLQKSYDIPPGDYSENICIYKCIRQGQYPFLLFLTVYDKSKKSLVFPSAPELVKIEEETPDDEIEKLVIEPFKSTLFDIFPPSESKPLDIESEQVVDVYSPELFNGFFMTEENLWLTYDATRIGVEPAEDKEYFWVTPYEVLVLYQLRNINIDDSVISFF
jgi:flagellar motor protein MotB